MNLRALAIVSAAVLTSLAACRKQQSGVSLRVSVSDANTSKVWRKGSDDGRLWTLLIQTGTGIGGQINGDIARVVENVAWALVVEAMQAGVRDLPEDVKQRLITLIRQNPALLKLARQSQLVGPLATWTTNVAKSIPPPQRPYPRPLKTLQEILGSTGLLNLMKDLLTKGQLQVLKPVLDVLEQVLEDSKSGSVDFRNPEATLNAISQGFLNLVKGYTNANVFVAHWWLVDPLLARHLVLWLLSELETGLLTQKVESPENVKRFKAMLETLEQDGFSTKLGSGIAKIIGHTGKHGGPKIITAGLKRDLITDLLVSAEDSNHNDAKISWIKVTYIDKNGKRIEDNIGEQPIGADFSKEYQIPDAQTITVTARAEQTGETKNLAQHIQELSDVGEFNHQTTLPQLRDGIHRLLAYRKHWLDSMPGKRVGNARVRLKLELLQDGIVIGSKEIEAEKEVEATSVGYGGQKGGFMGFGNQYR